MITVPVTFPEAALGAEVKVPTLGGTAVTVRVPAGTPNGRVMRVRGRGVQRKDGTRGDLLVTVEVEVPAQLDEAARAAVTAYREATAGRDPRAGMFERSEDPERPFHAAAQTRTSSPSSPSSSSSSSAAAASTTSQSPVTASADPADTSLSPTTPPSPRRTGLGTPRATKHFPAVKQSQT